MTIINKNIVDKLKNYNQYNLMNILFYGKTGAGKRTIVHSFIKHMYNLKNLDIRIHTYTSELIIMILR